MSEEKKGPTHRVSFAAFQRDADSEGERRLGSAREIGAIWERKDRDGEGILRFDHTPREDGIYFVKALGTTREGPQDERPSPRKRERSSERER
jgi:hypothetical protein